MTAVPEWFAVLGLVVPAGTGLAGYWLAGRNERARDERVAEREAIARRVAVRERLEEQSHAAQRETLLELQDTLQRLIRCTAKMLFHDQQTLKTHGTLTQLGKELNDESYEIGVTTRRLQERLLDSVLREAVGEFRSHVAGVEASFVFVKEMSVEDGIKHIDSQLQELTRRYSVVNEAVGAALRAELGWLPEERQTSKPA